MREYESFDRIGVLPHRSYYIPFSEADKPKKRFGIIDRNSSSRFISLDGEWLIKQHNSPKNIDISEPLSEKIPVPSCVQMHGYDKIQYINDHYPFPVTFPHMPNENPTWHYRKAFRIDKKDGEKCGCGRLGCWEAYGSATALIRQTKAAIEANPDSELAKLVDGDLSKVNGKTAFDAMRAGCPVGKAVVEKFVEYFSTGVTNIINIFQPEKLVIGGGVSKEGQPLIDMIMKKVNAERYGEGTGLPLTTLCTAVLGNDAGIIGAAALGI